jgi:hypothetical protein
VEKELQWSKGEGTGFVNLDLMEKIQGIHELGQKNKISLFPLPFM